MPTESHPRPNIVLIMSDQHNASFMGWAGNPVVRTPNLDALAAESVAFTDANCPFPLCVPSRAGFMAGRYPTDIGSFCNAYPLDAETPTFAHGLGAAGYEAVICGKMHFLENDMFHGFEKRLLPEVPHEALSREILGSGYNRTNGQTRYAVQVAGWGRTGYQAYDREVTRRSCEYVAARSPGDRPFCLVVGMILPHNPLICSKGWFDYYMDALPAPRPVSREYLDGLHPAMKAWRSRRGTEDLSPRQVHRALAAYCGLVSEMDENVGRVVRAVKDSPAAGNTIVIYCTDHGDMAYQHGMWWKSSFYNGSIRTPLTFSWPGRFPAGRRVDAVVNLIDVGPTLLEIAGGQPLPDAAGRSLLGFLGGDGRVSDWPDETFAEYHGLWGDGPACMVRRGPWKLNYYHEFRSHQLFNLADDPDELVDRASDPACGTIAAECLERIRARWSAEDVLARAAEKDRRLRYIRRCGHEEHPHQIEPMTFRAEDNQFDFGQLAR